MGNTFSMVSREEYEELLSVVRGMAEVLRDHRMHQPECPARKVEKSNQEGLWYTNPDDHPCTCWLSFELEGE